MYFNNIYFGRQSRLFENQLFGIQTEIFPTSLMTTPIISKVCFQLHNQTRVTKDLRHEAEPSKRQSEHCL